jgi:hypothetical protein
LAGTVVVVDFKVDHFDDTYRARNQRVYNTVSEVDVTMMKFHNYDLFITCIIILTQFSGESEALLQNEDLQQLTIHAFRDIGKGEEITLFYLHDRTNYSQRNDDEVPQL